MEVFITLADFDVRGVFEQERAGEKKGKKGEGGRVFKRFR